MGFARALLGALVVGLGLSAVAAPAWGSPRVGPPRAPENTLTIFRVDVSHYPQVGLVVTVPGTSRQLTGHDFTVSAGGPPLVKRLSPGDLEVALAPDAGLAATALHAERAAATRFLAGLPAGARTVTVDPATPGVLPGRLSGDPAPAVASVASLVSGVRSDAAARLATALSAFTAGSRVRRTIVLTVSADRSLSKSLAARFRAQLLASGTSLYVLDAAPGGAPAYDALATGTGGFAARVRLPGDWAAACARITAQLAGQYYLRFTDSRPLPGQVRVSVSTGAAELHGIAALPAHNPVAPRLPALPRASSPPGLLSPGWDAPLVLLAMLLIITGVSYGMGMLLASRREPARAPGRQPRRAGDAPPEVPDDLFFVFLMPCLNEEAVIGNSLRRLLSIPGENFAVLVIDDASDDGTADVVAAMADDRVWLLRRRAPEARQGKGEALNAAVRYLTGGGHLEGRDPDRVIAVVVDADGRLDPRAIERVAPLFADPATGAVQIGVRINNRAASRLARMQDMEFVIYTEVFQRGRRHLGSVGLGGNGQFMRLSAMLSLGDAPWTRSLTDDLDLGVRMIAAGWRNEYCREVAVHQQGVVELRRLIRQRSRWFQGHLQSWKLIPLVLRKAPRRARADLLYHLSSPAVLLIASLLSASFVVSLANAGLAIAQGRNPAGWWVASTYALTFGPALAFSTVYWSREHHGGVGALRTIGFAHLYVCYGMMWYAAGWWAVGRTLRGRTGWAKTDRVSESPAVGVPVTRPALAAGPGASATAATGPALARPAVIADPQRPRRPRQGRRRAAVAAALLLGGAAAGLAAVEAAQPADGSADWQQVFTGYGATSVTGSGASLAVTLDPATATAPGVSHAALVVSKRVYPDFVATLRVSTLRQLRQGAAGQAQPWEVGWVVWHYTSDHSFYALTLERTGWVLSKQDPAYPGDERFLASGLSPVFQLGVPHTVGIVQSGGQITVSADGQLLTRFTDTQRPYLSGAVGLYTEDATARFDHIQVDQLPATP